MSVEVLIDAARQNQQSKDVLYIFTLLVLTCRINVYFMKKPAVVFLVIHENLRNQYCSKSNSM